MSDNSNLINDANEAIKDWNENYTEETTQLVMSVTHPAVSNLLGKTLLGFAQLYSQYTSLLGYVAIQHFNQRRVNSEFYSVVDTMQEFVTSLNEGVAEVKADLAEAERYGNVTLEEVYAMNEQLSSTVNLIESMEATQGAIKTLADASAGLIDELYSKNSDTGADAHNFGSDLREALAFIMAENTKTSNVAPGLFTLETSNPDRDTHFTDENLLDFVTKITQENSTENTEEGE